MQLSNDRRETCGNNDRGQWAKGEGTEKKKAASVGFSGER